ncbi:MAG: CehA/McbA family metallohydrolase [Steroidobacteraceae bacterium]|jgi:Tol biopolymer transport system component
MLPRILRCAALLAGCIASAISPAARLPVLGQIDLPHPYYYREMYLPQLTAGPSSLAWSPDSKELIYSMGGSLWRQRLGTTRADQLAGSGGYDYQPDWSPDGRWVIYSAYAGEALELWVLDLQSGVSRPLTSNGAVNVEPRFSPDGRRVVFVSTLYNRRFHVFTADFAAGALRNVLRLTGEHKSELPRYYYSAYDHEISPVWTRDGRDILYVSNRGHIYGTGGFWRTPASAASAAAGDEAREIHYEETNWKARPDVSPDGSRLVFSSYEGRGWHNLWVMPAAGGDAFPIAYGDWDQTNARWSPDGASVAFISNQSGSTEIEVLRIPGGTALPLVASERRYALPRASLRLQLRDAAGNPASARVSVTDAAGRFYAPDDSWIHADDGFDRNERRTEAHYFHARGAVTVDVPAGPIHVEILRGFERRFERRQVAATAGQVSELAVNLDDARWSVPDAAHWVSADAHVHMNYGGVYRNTPAHLVGQAQAENLGLVNALIVNKEQRFPDIAYNGRHVDAASAADALVVHGQEFHTSYWGHLGILDTDAVILPGYSGYPNTAASSLYPMNADVADLAHARGAVVGYVHPFDEYPDPLAEPHQVLTNELPVDVALGKVDYMEILGFSDHRSTAAVWYRLLNLGFRLPAAAGTDAMANFASLRGPVGMNRVYARVADGPLDVRQWLDALKAGRTFATNGPLLGLEIGAAHIGDELKFAGPQRRVPFSVRVESIVPVDHLELVCNGRVVQSFVQRKPVDHARFSGDIPVADSGWCVLRASSDAARYPVLDNYVYATTSPIYLTVAGHTPRSAPDARYFRAWIDRVTEATVAYPDWNSEAEKRGVLGRLAQAGSVYEALERSAAAR